MDSAASVPRRELALETQRALADLGPDELVLVACSGGADSLALAQAAADCASKGVIRAGAVVIDHQLQDGSADVAQAAGQQCVALGLDPVEVVAVDVATGPGNGGMEAAARTARRAALLAAARRHHASALLLAHTRDDQAETVMLGLLRGSGSRSLAGMRPVDGMWRRPLLGIDRQTVRDSVAGTGLSIHEDPHNSDETFARVRVRQQVLPTLVAQLGDRTVLGLARTAELLAADNEALDEWTRREAAVRLVTEPIVTVSLEGSAGSLGDVPPAVRRRLFRLAALAAGCPAGSLTAAHLEQVDRLVGDWRGQGAVRLPGEQDATRSGDTITIGQAWQQSVRQDLRS